MKSGKLRNVVDILRATEATDELGTVVDVWNILSTTRCSISPIEGSEYFINSEIVNDATYYIIMRSTDVTPEDRLDFEGAIYDITQVLDTMEYGIELTILAKERFNT